MSIGIISQKKFIVQQIALSALVFHTVSKHDVNALANNRRDETACHYTQRRLRGDPLAAIRFEMASFYSGEMVV